ncbi:MAG: thioredoxin family protein [candidate division KSB1 bacterium]|nr:thioredoxin family protein [candidate division KSB1 bacterium]MDZ7276456.1 thioredoxin family protein [candidate division KSB1 bacterium]MDZ7288125.1 thioredoxin family protein [candidate division KSB1 bacterium]MDZ7300226.1 thioredoxin family protein [candidate division KSB1 bacterium]MDZ7309129.1 thioredoxin family protein [candidate division KSB1 bacterium]
MKIQIFGPGCLNCKTLEQRARRAAEELGVKAEFEKVTDIAAIMTAGVLRTPGLAIDGKLMSQGRVNSVEEIKIMLGQFIAAGS